MNLSVLKLLLKNIAARWRTRAKLLPENLISDTTQGADKIVPKETGSGHDDKSWSVYRGIADAEEAVFLAKLAKRNLEAEKQKKTHLEFSEFKEAKANWNGIYEFIYGLSNTDRQKFEGILNHERIKQLTGWRMAYFPIEIKNPDIIVIRGHCKCGQVVDTKHSLFRREAIGNDSIWFWQYIVPKILETPHCCFTPGPSWRFLQSY